VAGQVIPPLAERDRITRGLICRLDDAVAADEGEALDLEVLELLVPFATQSLTFALARSEMPPRMEAVDLARVAIVQRVLNALPTSYGLLRRHLYLESIGASRALLEGALLLRYFQRRPERAGAWFDDPDSFRRLPELRKEIEATPRDEFYGWSSALGQHVTAAGFKMLAGVSADGTRIEMSIGGRFDPELQLHAAGVLLSSASSASGALTDTFMHDLSRLPTRGRQAFVQLMKAGLIDRPLYEAIRFTAAHLKVDERELRGLLERLDAARIVYRDEAAKLEAAGILPPPADHEF